MQRTLCLGGRDGAIMRASLGPPSALFSAQVWIPFAEWVNANHPEHAAVMYNSPDADGARLTEEAFPLWEQDAQEYVQVVLTSRAAYAAEVGTICTTQAAQLGELARARRERTRSGRRVEHGGRRDPEPSPSRADRIGDAASDGYDVVQHLLLPARPPRRHRGRVGGGGHRG